MSSKKLILSFVIIAIVVSVALAYLGAFISPWKGLEASVFTLLFGPLMLVPFYAVFVLLGGILLGLPTLIVLRRLGLSLNPIAFVFIGTSVGAAAGALLLGAWFGLAVLNLGMGFGAAGGGIAALLWFYMVELKVRHA